MKHKEYPELNVIANKLSKELVVKINEESKLVESKMRYKAQHILEEIIKRLEKLV